MSEYHSPKAVVRSVNDDHRILPIRPRRAATVGEAQWREPIHHRDANTLLLDRFAQYERGGEDDDFQHRMIMNGLAFAVVVVLTATGSWLGSQLAASEVAVRYHFRPSPNYAQASLAFDRQFAPSGLATGFPR
jgi:hypothetical protein